MEKNVPEAPATSHLMRGFSSRQLQAFYALAQTLHFSQAAERISITQSALSQRIQNLEQTIGQQLFNRGHNHITLTHAGHRLLRYCQLRETFEQEFLYDFDVSQSGELSGALRIGGFSSIIRSAVMPIINQHLVRDNPDISCEFVVDEMHSLTKLLMMGKVEFVITQFPVVLNGVVSVELGMERNFLIESTDPDACRNVYIDHEPSDHFTEHFFSLHEFRPEGGFRRAFYEDIYGLLDAVNDGIGRAVIPMHLLTSEHRCRPVRDFSAVDFPVVLSYYKTNRHSRLHRAAENILKQHIQGYLQHDHAGLQKHVTSHKTVTQPYGHPTPQ